MLYGYIKDPDDGQDIDEALACVMRAPHSYTGEDVVELNCHGGMLPLRKVLEAAIKKGAAMAQPGEFTKRAFLNGRIDLAQAESVMDIITAKSDVALSSSIMQLEGKLSRAIENIRDGLLQILSHIEALIDYPEEDVDELDISDMRSALNAEYAKIDALLATADTGRIIREGLKTAIVGRPNVGKSSLLNALLRADKAIVTDIPGTTRDIIEDYANIKGIALNIIDTAGIREAVDEVERIGVERAREAAHSADLIIMVFDASCPISEEDRAIASLISSKKVIAVLNKTDIDEIVTVQEINAILPNAPVIKMSLMEGYGLEELEQTIADMVYQGKAVASSDAMVTNVRHKEALLSAKNALQRCLSSLDAGMPIDLLSIDIEEAISALGLISGKTVSDEVIDMIFERFCVGK